MAKDKKNSNGDPEMPEKVKGGSTEFSDDPKSHAPTIRHEIQSEIKRKDTDATALAETSGPTDIVEGYGIVSKLGEGGMGVVYKAVQRSLSRDVALKLMKDMGDDESFVARFRREAMTGGRLNHPNIVAVYDHGHIEGNVYLVLEYIKGRNCAEMIEASGRMDVRLATQIIRGCVLGLSHAQQLGVIHRDIKPANIMIVEDDNSDARGNQEVQPKIADFGLARLHDGNDPDHIELTQAGSVMGTPGYMAPEQALGREVDFRADIYSLGSTFYCLLTGTKPFHGASMVEVLHKKLNETAPNPQDLVGEIPDAVVLVLDRMMAKSQDDRYQSYENLLSDLDAVLAGEVPQTDTLDAAASSLDVGGKDTRKKLRLRPGGAKSTKSLAVIAIGVVSVIAALVWAFMPPADSNGGTSSQDDTEVASLKQKIDDWSARPAVASFGDFDALRASIGESLSRIDDSSKREKLSSRFKSSLATKLSLNEAFVLKPLEALWQRRAWQDLGDETEVLKGRYGHAGIESPKRLEELIRFANLARTGTLAQKEQSEFNYLESAKPNPETLRRLEGFIATFSFSPNLSWAKEELKRVQASLRQLSLASDFSALLVGLRKKDAQEFLRSWAKDETSWRLMTAALPQAEIASANSKLDSLIRSKSKSSFNELSTKFETLWQAHNYDELRGLLTESEKILEQVETASPVSWKPYRAIADASKGSAGFGEKMAWDALEGEKDLIVRISMLQSYLEKFGHFSPKVKQAQAALDEAAKKAPLLDLQVTPKSAVVRINKIKLSMAERRSHRAAGELQIEAEAPGYYDFDRTIEHNADRPIVRIQLAKKSARDIRLSPTQSGNIPLCINPRNTKVPPFPFLRGLQVAVDLKEAGVRVKASNMKEDLWRSTSRKIFDGRLAKILFPNENARYWQLHGRIIKDSGEAEIRMLEGDRGSQVVLGMRSAEDGGSESYFGIRSKDGKLTEAFSAPIKDNGAAIRFSMSWYGDVCVLGMCENMEDDPKKAKAVASIVLDYSPKRDESVSLSVKRGAALFANLELYPMN